MTSSVLFKWNNDANRSVDYVSESITKLLEYDIKDFSNISPDPTEYFIHKDRLTHYFLQQQDIGKVQWQTI